MIMNKINNINELHSCFPFFPQPPIIIGGCGRSGTSLLLSILSAHSHIHAIPFETRSFCENRYNSDVDINQPFNWQVIAEHFDGIKKPIDAIRWCEKTPKNVHCFQKIIDEFKGNVRLINIVRDGRDVITSTHPLNRDNYWVTINRWINDVQAGVHFDYHPLVMVVRYEDLILNFEKTLKDLCVFLDEPYEKDLLNWQKNTKVTEHSAWDGKVEKLFSSSIGRGKDNTNKFRANCLISDKNAVNLLIHYGYIPWGSNSNKNYFWRVLLKKTKELLPNPLIKSLSFLRKLYRYLVFGSNSG